MSIDYQIFSIIILYIREKMILLKYKNLIGHRSENNILLVLLVKYCGSIKIIT